MKCYKGTDKDLKCRGQQYEVGKTYETPEARICETGFHACENPFDVFNYYPPASSRYLEVELDANEQTEKHDSKRVGTRISILAEIGIEGIVQQGIKYILNKINFGDDAATNAGDQSVAANAGDRSVAANTGDWSAAEATGEDGIAIATGYMGKAKGRWLVLAERAMDGRILDVKAFKADGVNIKPDTYYILENGVPVAVE